MHLVVVAGSAIVASYLVAVNESLGVLWGPDCCLRWFWSSLVLFFVTPLIFGSYVCRALRLAVVFHPRAKRALPWLIPVRGGAESPIPSTSLGDETKRMTYLCPRRLLKDGLARSHGLGVVCSSTTPFAVGGQRRVMMRLGFVRTATGEHIDSREIIAQAHSTFVGCLDSTP